MPLHLFYPLIPSLAQINMYVTDLRFAYTCLSKSSLEQTLFPVCPKIANAPCTNVQMYIVQCLKIANAPRTNNYFLLKSIAALVLPVCWLPQKPLLPLSSFSAFHFHFLTLSLVPLDNRAPTTFLTISLSLQKSEPIQV